MIERIISGGQTGVDRAALEVALRLGIACGGWCPKGRRAEDGAIPARYPLIELPSSRYAPRTQRNVQEADATLVLTRGTPVGGTALTVELARRLRRPLMVLDMTHPLDATAVSHWLVANGTRVLNVAGPRESQQPGIGRLAQDFLTQVLRAGGS